METNNNPEAVVVSGGHTPGPLHIQQDTSWPFTIRVCNQAGETIHSEPSVCSSSKWTSIDDVRSLRGIHGEQRQEWSALMGRQMADLSLRAAAPDLLEACEQAEAHIVELYRGIAPTSDGRFADADVSVQQLRAAIAKARGQ